MKIKSEQSEAENINLNSTISIVLKDKPRPITNLFDKTLTI